MAHKLTKLKFIPRWLVVILLFLIVGIMFFRFYVLPNAIASFSSALAPAKDTIEQADLKNYIGISLSEDATDFHGAAYSFMQSRIVGVRFQIPPTYLDEFLNNLGFTSELKREVNPFHPNSRTLAGNEWWKPETAKSFVGGSFTKSESFYDVLIDQTNSNYFLVYLMVEQM